MKPKVGEHFLAHGRLHEIIGIADRAVKRRKDGKVVAVLEDVVISRNTNGAGFIPAYEMKDLRWSEEDQAWYAPGRVLCKDERTVINAMMGAWPTAESHMAARKILDVEGPFEDHVDLNRLETVIRTRRLRRGYDLGAQKPLKEGVKITTKMSPAEINEALEACETEAAFDKRVKAYAKACLAHCEQIRAFRNGTAIDTPLPPNDGSPAAIKLRRIPGGGPYDVRGGSHG